MNSFTSLYEGRSGLSRVVIAALLVCCFLLSGVRAFAQCTMICQNELSVDLDANGQALITPNNILQIDPASCGGPLTIFIINENGNTVPNPVNSNYIGQNLTVTVIDGSTGNNCSTALTINDNMPPSMICSEASVICTSPTDPSVTGYPTVTDNVSNIPISSLQFSDQYDDFGCNVVINGQALVAQITRTWTATDEEGNMASCEQTINVTRATVNDVTFPAHLNDISAPSISCDANPTDLSITGTLSVGGYDLEASGACDLVTSFSDQTFETCGGAYRIHRTWAVVDFCTNEFINYIQIIDLNDNDAPSITCPADMTFNTYSTGCGTVVILPNATASDNCSEFDIVPSWEFGEGVGPYPFVPPGAYEVTYTATDACGNASTCTAIANIIDDDAPTAICQNNITVNLQADGSVFVYAASFDNGSHDNCGVTYFEVSLDGGTTFTELVELSCDDVMNSPLSAIMRAYDGVGLYSECTSSITVIDNTNPTITCPDNVTLHCLNDATDLALTGLPAYNDNCAGTTSDYVDNPFLNACGHGTINRLWTVTDASGNTAFCQQVITIQDNTPTLIEFPSDFTSYECGLSADPTITGNVSIVGADCEDIEITYEDNTFATVPGACYNIVRDWAVIDWCSFDATTGEGFWESTQVIQVLDDEAPEITCPTLITVGIDGNTCTAYVNIADVTATDCSQLISYSSNSIYADNPNSASLNGEYPKGTHTVTVTAADGCGNESSCNVTIIVEDTEAPVPACNNGVTVNIQSNGMVAIVPSMLNNGSYDNCFDASELSFATSPSLFTCADLGEQQVSLIVTDPDGNTAFCTTIVNVQDNSDICPPTSTTANVGGQLTTLFGDEVNAKQVSLSGGIAIATTSNANGVYDFTGLPMYQNYTITPSYNQNHLNGVTTFDMSFIRKHILGLEPFDSPYKYIAADANNSGVVTTADMVEIQKNILLINNGFANNTSWRFVDANFSFPTNGNPLAVNFPEAIDLANLSQTSFEHDFIAIKVGDMNGSANVNNLGGNSSERTNGIPTIIQTTAQYFEANDLLVVPFSIAEEDLIGMQFTIEFDVETLEYVEMEASDLANITATNLNIEMANEGVLTFAWDNASANPLAEKSSLFNLHFHTKKKNTTQNTIDINANYTPALAYKGSFTQLSSVEQSAIELAFTNDELKNSLILYQNEPNPFAGQAKIGFELPEANAAQLRIYDLTGQQIAQFNGDFEQGYNEFEINILENVRNTSVLIYQLSVPGHAPLTKKMIVR